MTDRDAFMAAIIADPDNDTPRLAYADWLDEHDEPERAEFIRLQCVQEQLLIRDPSTELQAKNLEKRRIEFHERGLIKKWVAEARALFPANRQLHLVYRRGLIGEMWSTTKYFVEHGDSFVQQFPIQKLVLNDPKSPRVTKLAELKGWRSIHRLSDEADKLNLEGARRLCSLPLDRITHLSLNGNLGFGYDPGDAWKNRVGEIVKTFVDCPDLAGLKYLDLTYVGIGSTGARALVESPYLRDLKFLDVRGNWLEPSDEQALRQRFGNRVTFDYDDYVMRFCYGEVVW